MKRTLATLLVAAVVLAGSLAGCDAGREQPAGLELQRTYQAPVDGSAKAAEGKLYLAGQVKVLQLSGTYKQMGME